MAGNSNLILSQLMSALQMFKSSLQHSSMSCPTGSVHSAYIVCHFLFVKRLTFFQEKSSLKIGFLNPSLNVSSIGTSVSN